MPLALQLNTAPDGFGFIYGTLDIGEECPVFVNIMPPAEIWTGTTRMDSLPVPGQWVVHIDGDEIARVATQQEVYAALQAYQTRHQGMDR